MTEHPLADVFRPTDLQCLAAGRCVESGGTADPDISWLLTEAVERGDSFILSIGQWYSLALTHGESVGRYYRQKLRSSVDSRAAFMRWCGELMAGWFLERQLRIEVEHVPESTTPTPDYRAHISGRETSAEVKTLVGGVSPGFVGPLASRAPLIRDAIADALRQLDRDKANTLLIADYYRPPVLPHTVIDALFGDLHFKLLYDDNGPVGDCFPAREEGIRFQPSINTRVSVLGTLFWNGKPDVYAYLYHNPYARCVILPEALDPWPQFVPDRERGVMTWRNRPEGVPGL